MQLKTWLIETCSLISKWNEEREKEWLNIRDMTLLRFFFYKNFHVYGLCMLVGLQLATWINYANSHPDFMWVDAVIRNTVLCVGASILYAFFTRMFTERSFQCYTNNRNKRQGE